MLHVPLLTMMVFGQIGEYTSKSPSQTPSQKALQSLENPGVPIPIAQSFTGVDTQLATPQRLRVVDEPSWRSVWSEHLGMKDVRGRGRIPTPKVDFSRHMVIGMVEKPARFKNGIEISRLAVDMDGDIQVVTIDYRGADAEGAKPRTATKNVYGFFVIPRYEPELVLRRRTNSRFKEVERFHALPDAAVTIVLGEAPPSLRPSPAKITQRTQATIAKTADRASASSAHTGGLNIGFAYDPGHGNYDGVVGGPGDVWNFVDIGTTAVDYTRHPNAAGSTARLRITRHDGEWAVKDHPGIFRGYIYHNCRCVDLEVTLLDLEPARYRAYVYAHGDAPKQNAKIEVVVGDRSIGAKATTKSDAYRSTEFKEGNQYVTFEFDVPVGKQVHIISHRDGSDYSMFNAIQLVPVKAP